MTCHSSQPVVEILSRVAAELTELAHMVDNLHSLVDGMEHLRDAQREVAMRDAQSIDLIEQRLSSLAHFFSELLEMIPPDWEITGKAAAQKLKLSALAHRLSAAEGSAGHDHAAGEYEGF